MRTHLALVVLIATFLIVGASMPLNTPDWQAPDEPAHYNYIRQLAAGSSSLLSSLAIMTRIPVQGYLFKF